MKSITKAKKNAKHRILDALVGAQYKRVYWYGVQLPEGYLTTGHLCHPGVGGSSAPRRVREMRAAGIDIDLQSFSAVTPTNEHVHTWIYALRTHYSEIDFTTGTLRSQQVA